MLYAMASWPPVSERMVEKTSQVKEFHFLHRFGSDMN